MFDRTFEVAESDCWSREKISRAGERAGVSLRGRRKGGRGEGEGVRGGGGVERRRRTNLMSEESFWLISFWRKPM